MTILLLRWALTGALTLACAGVSAQPGMSQAAGPTEQPPFTGRPAHAAAASERGRSAPDGVEAMNLMVNMPREHTTEFEERIGPDFRYSALPGDRQPALDYRK